LYNYKYNGKELQESGMYDCGARFYIPDVNGKKHYIKATSTSSAYNGHSIDNILKEFGVDTRYFKKKK
jgi:hypothetical protein